MQLDFTNLFGLSDEVINIDYIAHYDDFMYSTYKPLKDGVVIKGKAYCKADIVHLDLDISFNFYGICDRCDEDIKKEYSFSVHKIMCRGWKMTMMILMTTSSQKTTLSILMPLLKKKYICFYRQKCSAKRIVREYVLTAVRT